MQLAGCEPQKPEEALPDPLRHLTAKECAALEDFVARLRRRHGHDLLRVVLFGSKARGDADEELDLDVLVVVRTPEEGYWQHWLQIADLTWEVEFEYHLVLSPLIRDQATYEQMQQWNLLINRNIEQDVIILWTRRPNESSLAPV